MLRLKPANLQAGMITAEPVLDFSGKVLLKAKTRLTQSAIELLRAWEVNEVMIYDGPDAGLSEAEMLDAAIAWKIGINDEAIAAILGGGEAGTETAEESAGLSIGSLVNQEGIRVYEKLLEIMSRLLQALTKEREFSVKEFNELARIITDYVLSTPGVLAYALRPQPGEIGELARHLVSTAVIAGKIADMLHYPQREINSIVLASLIHDIGKSGLPENARSASASQSGELKRLYRSHVQLGLTRIKGKHWIPREVQLAMAQHHEWMDGSGFPMGVAGDKIHPYARIIAVADYVDKAGRRVNGIGGIIRELPFLAGRFDPVICAELRGYLTDFLMHNTLELEDGRTAQIIYMHQAYPEPVIRTNDGEFIDLNTAPNIKVERYIL